MFSQHVLVSTDTRRWSHSIWTDWHFGILGLAFRHPNVFSDLLAEIKIEEVTIRTMT